ncbi:glycoside hydrolase family 43 protein [Micromonospora sp. NPDC005413]|uniref:glycoside hydrolase family 43 protein n=1 Tax=Micromonospora sp. NPDC005413 TaxID=3154563 RepID=UPI0033A5E929
MSRRRWFAAAAAATVTTVLTGVALTPDAHAANPIITNIYTADPAPLVVGNTMYIYAGRDEAAAGNNNFVMREWRVLSSTDAATWTDNGVRANIGTFGWAGADAWAGEVEPRNGRYYWYTSINGNGPGWMDIGVAVGDSPLGPFTDAKGGPLISDSTANSSGLNIDPTVFVDDDGQAYIYWGGYWGARAARLKPNMIELDGPVVTPAGLTNYWEAPWMFKRNGLYYMMYAANDTGGCVTSSSYACQRYATATNPMGPWTHRGIVLGQVSSTTNHAGIVQFNGQWYIVYHNANAPGGGNFRRSVAVDRLSFNADGTIQQVVQTTTGPPPNPGGGNPTTPPPTNPGQPPAGTNLAPSATRSTSYVSTWESLAAINNGGVPANSQDRSNLAYGNWPQQGTQWIEYQWPSARTVNRTATYWFDDNQGIDLPASCQVQYWNGSAYVNVPNQSGCPVAGDAYNVTTFSSVSTTRLRLSITSKTGLSTGVLEWMAFQA